MTAGAVTPDAAWGIRPVLFSIGQYGVSSYMVFMLLALATGFAVYAVEAARNKSVSEHTLIILLSALAGGALGAKLPILVLHARELAERFPDLSLLMSGRSVVGGLLGGALAVYAVKRRLGIRERKGNLFAPAIAAGVAVGRIGCFLRGCCAGTPTGLPWGIDFGDGVARHPTQLYEALFMLALFALLFESRKRVSHPAVLLWVLMVSYFSFRFAVEFIRTEQVVALGLTLFQWISLLAVVIYARKLVGIRTRAREGPI